MNGFLASRRHAISLAFGLPFSPWALDTMVAPLVGSVVASSQFDVERSLPSGGLGGDVSAVAALQAHRFRDRLRHAAQTVPYYRDLFQELSIDPDGARPAHVPITRKDTLRERPEDFVSMAARPFVRVTTTGTTGRPTVVHFSRREWRTIGALSAFSMIGQRRVAPDDIVHIAITPRAVLPNHAVMSSCAAAGAVVHVVGMAHPEEALTLLAQRHHIAGKKDRVSVMTGNPSYVGLLVEHGLAAGWRPEQFGVEQMLLGGELVTEGLRRRAERLFGPVRVSQPYALTELVPLIDRRWEPRSGPRPSRINVRTATRYII